MKENKNNSLDDSAKQLSDAALQLSKSFARYKKRNRERRRNIRKMILISFSCSLVLFICFIWSMFFLR